MDTEIEWTISGTIQPPLRHLYGYRRAFPHTSAGQLYNDGST